jgi:hypothetical protein
MANAFLTHFEVRIFSPMAQKQVVGQGLFITEASQSQLYTPHSLGLLWMSDQSNTETSTWQHTTQQTDINAPCRIQTHNSSKWAAADPCLRRQGHWDRPLTSDTSVKFVSTHYPDRSLRLPFSIYLLTAMNYTNKTDLLYITITQNT